MGAQTKAGYKPFSKGHLEAVVNPLKHSYVYDSANNETLKSKKITFNEDTTLEGDL